MVKALQRFERGTWIAGWLSINSTINYGLWLKYHITGPDRPKIHKNRIARARSPDASARRILAQLFLVEEWRPSQVLTPQPPLATGRGNNAMWAPKSEVALKQGVSTRYAPMTACEPF